MEDPLAYLFADLMDDDSIYLGERMAVDENTDVDFLFAQALQQSEEESWRKLREIEEKDAKLAKELLEEEQKYLHLEEEDRKFVLSLLHSEGKAKKEEDDLEFIKKLQEEQITAEYKRRKIEEEDEKIARSLAEKEVPGPKTSLFDDMALAWQLANEDEKKKVLETDEQLAQRLQAELQEVEKKQLQDAKLAQQLLDEEIARNLQEDMEQTTREIRDRDFAERAFREEQDRELAERALREERDREIAEKTFREDQDMEIAERTYREEMDREMAEKARWEKRDREIAQRLARKMEKEDEAERRERHLARIKEQKKKEEEELRLREAKAHEEAQANFGHISEAKRYVADLTLLNALWVQYQYKYGKSTPVASPQIAFHGTKSQRMPSIEQKGLLVPGSSGVSHATDSGWYGRGIYLSPNPSLSLRYSDDGRLIICAVLLGKNFKCKTRMDGAGLQPGWDSHSSPCGQELVLFDPGQVLPLFVLNTRPNKNKRQQKM